MTPEFDTNLRPALDIHPGEVALPPVIKRATATLNTTGWLGFWVQTVFGAIALLLLGFASFSLSVGTNGEKWGLGFSVSLAVVGFLSLLFAIYWTFRYTRIAKRLQRANPNTGLNKTETTNTLWIGLSVNAIGVGLALLGAETISTSILARTLAQPEGVAVYSATKTVRPLDVVLVLTNINLIAAHFSGTVASLWSLWLINRD